VESVPYSSRLTSPGSFLILNFRMSAFQLSAFDIILSLAREVYGWLLHWAAFPLLID